MLSTYGVHDTISLPSFSIIYLFYQILCLTLCPTLPLFIPYSYWKCQKDASGKLKNYIGQKVLAAAFSNNQQQ